MIRPRLVATIGPPAAGKSTFRQRFRGAHPAATVINLDTYRAQLSWCHCPANQAATPLTVHMGHTVARAVLAHGGTVLWDATNAERADRLALLTLAAELPDVRTEAVVLLPPLDVVLKRNARRSPSPCCCGYSRRVPADVVVADAQRYLA